MREWDISNQDVGSGRFFFLKGGAMQGFPLVRNCGESAPLLILSNVKKRRNALIGQSTWFIFLGAPSARTSQASEVIVVSTFFSYGRAVFHLILRQKFASQGRRCSSKVRELVWYWYAPSTAGPQLEPETSHTQTEVPISKKDLLENTRYFHTACMFFHKRSSHPYMACSVLSLWVFSDISSHGSLSV